MQAPVSIRRAKAADTRELGQLGAWLVRMHHDLDPDRFIPATPETEQSYAAFLASELQRPEAVVLVAEADGKVVGYAYAGMEDHDWVTLRGPAGVLYDLVVEAERRGNGIGRALLEAAFHQLAQRGAPRVILATAERNDAARRLFANAGFRPTMIEMTRETPRSDDRTA